MTPHASQPKERNPAVAPQGKCGATNRQGEPCGKPAGWGTPGKTGRCRLHGGASPNGRKNAQKLQAVAAVATYGLPREIDPHTALLEELHRTAGHVAWLGSLLQAGDLPAEQNTTGKARKIKLTQSVFGAGEQPSVWLQMYTAERKHLESVAKTCVAVGIAERQIRVAEQHASLMAEAIRGILTDLGVADRPEVPDVVHKHLVAIAGGAA